MKFFTTKTAILGLKSGRGVFSLLLVLAFVMSAGALKAQDLHFSQFYHSPLNLNPALAGIYSGDIRFIANYNSQWENVPVDYTTFSGAVEKKFYYDGLKSSYFAVGLLLNSDQAGDLNLGRINIGVTGSYSRQLAPILFATVGGTIGVTQRGFDTANLTTDADWDGQQFNPVGLTESFASTSTINPDFAAGLNLRLQPIGADRLTKRTTLDFGVGVHHLTSPNESFFAGGVSELPIRYSAYALGTLMLADNFDVLLRGMGQFQSTYRENVVGLSAKIHLNRNPSKEVAVVLGGSYRYARFSGDTADAIVPHIEFHVQQWLLGINYDVNISDFQTASLRQGGPEIAFRYILSKVKDLEVLKVCPII